ncbi:MAG: hypothetical protein ACRC7O_17040 [Fimbriiglobus sp.]
MTVTELIALVGKFPPELQVFFSPDEAGRLAVAPRDAVMNLVHPGLGEVILNDDPSPSVPEGYVDSLVIYPWLVRMDTEADTLTTSRR